MARRVHRLLADEVKPHEEAEGARRYAMLARVLEGVTILRIHNAEQDDGGVSLAGGFESRPVGERREARPSPLGVRP